MDNSHQIVDAVYAAKDDVQKADDLIRSYIPFIQSEASRFLSRPCTQSDDAYSIAMIAFHEAIVGYERSRGSFLKYAALLIRSRLVDYFRKEQRHQGHLSLHDPAGEDRTIQDTLAEETDHYELSATREATRQEIEELSVVLAQFGVTFAHVAQDCPQQERTLLACAKAIRYAGENRELLDTLLRTKKLPLLALAAGSGVERKTLERHRKYILAMLLIQTNGYEIIRGHLRHILKKGEVTA